MKFRKEYDSIGSINVPVDKYWGASTERSKKYFNIGDVLVGSKLIKSIAIIKKAAAITNYKNKDISSKIYRSIVRASDEVIKGKLDNHFPLKVWQTGSGTQTNMNVNEVVANRAIEILGGKKYIRDLSKGNQKKVGIVAALIGSPSVIILDEPFANLDPTTQIRLKKIIKKLSTYNRVTVLISSHDLQDVTEVSERIVLLEKGKIIKDIKTSEKTLKELESYFTKE